MCVFLIHDLLNSKPLLPEKVVCDVFLVLCYTLKIGPFLKMAIAVDFGSSFS